MTAQSDELSESLAALSRHLVAEESLESTLQRVATLACRTLPGCGIAGVTMLRDGRPTTTVCTDDVALEIDDAQYRSGSGPCLQAFRDGRVIRLESIEADSRWPEFSDAAVARGVHSSLSLPLVVGDESLGALNLYGREEGAFGDDDEETGELFAAQAAVALANAHVYWSALAMTQQLREALASRDVIGQAKGIIMAQRGLGADDAFDVLRRASQRENIKLREVAQRVVDSARRRGAVEEVPG